MRLWSIHPGYLDARGLVALWREALLAKKVLEGNTKGYRNHPQLVRFRAAPQPLAYINAFLREVYAQAFARGYRFNETKLDGAARGALEPLAVTAGQVAYEFAFLQQKLARRCPLKYAENLAVAAVETNAVFTLVAGEIECWERVKSLKKMI